MKKSDLKTGMRIVFKTYEEETICFYDGRIPIKFYGDQLSFYSFDSEYREDFSGEVTYKITRIYDKPEEPCDLLNKNKLGELLWERKEETFIELDGIEYSESTLRSIIKKSLDS